MTKYFDVEHLIPGKDAEHFFCYAHLMDRLLSERSIDPRYCKTCYDFLVVEGEGFYKSGKTTDWLPLVKQELDKAAIVDDKRLDVAEKAVTTVNMPDYRVLSDVTDKLCVTCGTPLKAGVRSDARFCSGACRVQYHRQLKQLQLTLL